RLPAIINALARSPDWNARQQHEQRLESVGKRHCVACKGEVRRCVAVAEKQNPGGLRVLDSVVDAGQQLRIANAVQDVGVETRQTNRFDACVNQRQRLELAFDKHNITAWRERMELRW